jgi:hypothetical protein
VLDRGPNGVESLYLLGTRYPGHIRPDCVTNTGEIMGVMYHPYWDRSGFVPANSYPSWYNDLSPCLFAAKTMFF